MTTDQQSVDAFLETLMDELSTRVAAKLVEAVPHPDRLLTPEEAAERLNVNVRTVRNLTARLKGEPPKLASVLIGDGARRILQSDVDAYIASRRVASGGRDR